MAKKKKTEPAKSGMAESETYQRWRGAAINNG
jgi:hypothetical protein